MAPISVEDETRVVDIYRTISGYSDIIAMRHPAAGSVAEFAAASRVPVVNGGDGPNEHPTQALLDLYTIRKEVEHRGCSIDGLRIAMIGDLRHGRTVHSLANLLGAFERVSVVCISPAELRLPPAIVESLRGRGHTVRESDNLEESIGGVDIAYATRIQAERFSSQEEIVRALGHEGVAVTQATLSRHLRSLGVGKRPDAAGRTDYALPAPRSASTR